MGEVYRADDLKLGQPVALKFLPRSFADDPVRRERFFAEVRITRQLSHPNICRVYDIAEFEGQHFLSMEFIDGEDLASLIRRIGHLTNEKALEVARQLIAGLAAAHERGVLHRDLKPANIMIDGHGRVRITDFGIAIAAEDETQAAEISGTPLYMAPEQLAGKGATVRSDIYALGLVLYEICCGKRAFTVGTLAELREQKEAHTPRPLSEIQTGVDPILERLITRCIDPDPRARPSSTLQLAAALPGGDPLAAAIAAGETPSPEMVAASSAKEGLRPAFGVALVFAVIVGLLGITILKDRFSPFQQAPGKSPELLADRAQELRRAAGYTESSVDSASGYLTEFILPSQTNLSSAMYKTLAKAGFRVWFWHRQSPESLQHWTGSVGILDPPPIQAGESLVELDTEARLRYLRVIPSTKSPATSTSAPNWAFLFQAAGFDESKFTRSEPEGPPPYYADAQAAWKGVIPQAPDIPIRIEAAAFQGRPVYFEIFGAPRAPSAGSVWIFIVEQVVLFALIVGALFLLRQNIRLGRGDRKGAAKLAVLYIGSRTIAWILAEHHIAAEAWLVYLFAGSTLLGAAAIWCLYMALEPILRRHRPQCLISWTRLLSGEWRDPLVGRDVLAGCAVGLAIAYIPLMSVGGNYGAPAEAVMGTRFLVATILTRVGGSASIALGALVLFFLLKKLFRWDWAVLGVVGLVCSALLVFSQAPWPAVVGVPLFVVLILFVPLRLGLLTSAVTMFVFVINVPVVPMTLDTSAWYFTTGLATALMVLAISLFGFRVAIGNRSLFETPSLD